MHHLTINSDEEELRVSDGFHKYLPLLGLCSMFLQSFAPVALKMFNSITISLATEDIVAAINTFSHMLRNSIIIHSIFNPEPIIGDAYISEINNFWTYYWQQEINHLGNNFWYLIEFFSVYNAIHDWLEPEKSKFKPNAKLNIKDGYLKPKEKYLQNTPAGHIGKYVLFGNPVDIMPTPDNFFLAGLNTVRDPEEILYFKHHKPIDCVQILIDGYQKEIFRYRTKNVGNILWVSNKEHDFWGHKGKILSSLYNSEDLLSLMWMEIKWAIENNVFAHTCESCGSIFTFRGGDNAKKSRYSRETYSCSIACRNRLKKLRLGERYFANKQKVHRLLKKQGKAKTRSRNKDSRNINSTKKKTP
jgi:hypothetical protein